jgi:hypothetical protein
MAWCEANGIDYVFGLPGNKTLHADPVIVTQGDACATDRALRGLVELRRYAETRYAAGLAPIKWRGIASTDRLLFELCGAEVVERRMAPNGIVEAIDISGNVTLGFGAGEESGSPNQFRFQCLEERLDHRVVVAIALARHRDPDAVAA